MMWLACSGCTSYARHAADWKRQHAAGRASGKPRDSCCPGLPAPSACQNAVASNFWCLRTDDRQASYSRTHSTAVDDLLAHQPSALTRPSIIVACIAWCDDQMLLLPCKLCIGTTVTSASLNLLPVHLLKIVCTAISTMCSHRASLVVQVVLPVLALLQPLASTQGMLLHLCASGRFWLQQLLCS